MSEKTFITGKDAPLEQSIGRMQSQLEALGFTIEETRWLNPVPNVWSVHVRDRDCPLLFANGKGASRKAALASALGEFMERLATNYFFTDFFLGSRPGGFDFVHHPREKWFDAEGDTLPEGLLDEPMREAYDPEGALRPAHLVDFNSDREAICALPFTRQRDGRETWVPTNLLANLYASNGMAAGNSRFEARTQALSEILERAVKNHIIREGISLPDVPRPFLQNQPGVRDAIQALEDAGFPVWVRDASLGGRFPVVNVTLLHPETGGCYASFGAHPSFEVALERTLTELLQGRPLDELGDFHPPSFDLEAAADPHNLELHFIDSSGVVAWEFLGSHPDHEFVAWDFADTTDHESERLTRLIQDMGLEVYIADFDHLGTPACRIIVPGLSEVYPVDDLWLENTNRARPLRRALFRLPELDAEECGQLLEHIEDEGFDDMMTVAQALGFAAGDSEWSEVRFGELKALLALAAKDHELASQWLERLLLSGQLQGERRRCYHCLLSVMELDQREAPNGHYDSALEHLFGADRVQWARRVLNHPVRFPGLEPPTADMRHFGLHRRLLAAYRRAQQAKAEEAGLGQ